MKSIVLDGDKIAEAIQKAKDKMINGEYDNNDLILRGDALKAIRLRCISEHLPFKSNTPVGARVLDALAAVYQVKPYKVEPKATVWHDAQNDPPKENGEYLCYYEYFRYGNYNRMYRTMDRGQFFNGNWGGEPTHGTRTKVLAWMPLPKPPEDTESLKLSYRGYTATIEYDDDDKLWHGKLDKIHDMINFHSFKAEEIEREFHNAVNDYLDFCKEIGKKPDEPHD